MMYLYHVKNYHPYSPSPLLKDLRSKKHQVKLTWHRKSNFHYQYVHANKHAKRFSKQQKTGWVMGSPPRLLIWRKCPWIYYQDMMAGNQTVRCRPEGGPTKNGPRLVGLLSPYCSPKHGLDDVEPTWKT